MAVEIIFQVGDMKYWQEHGDKKVKEKETWLAIQKVTNRMGLVFPVIVFCLFAGTILYLLKYQFMTEVANITDFIVATMSFAVLIVSYIRTRLDKKKQYIWISSVYILLLTVGLVIFMLVALKVEDVGSKARMLSCICLGITIAQEIISIVKIEHEINVEGEHRQEDAIKKIESESITRI